jgi:hypothetical protein
MSLLASPLLLSLLDDSVFRFRNLSSSFADQLITMTLRDKDENTGAPEQLYIHLRLHIWRNS